MMISDEALMAFADDALPAEEAQRVAAALVPATFALRNSTRGVACVAAARLRRRLCVRSRPASIAPITNMSRETGTYRC